MYGASFNTDAGLFYRKRYILNGTFMPSTARRTLLHKTFTALNMRECGFSVTLIFQYKCRIVGSVHIRKNNGQREPLFSHVLRSYYQHLFYLHIQYVVVIAPCRVQHGKYFLSFSYFATYFTSFWASEIIAKYEKQGKYLPILHEATCNNYFIVKGLLCSNQIKQELFYLLNSRLTHPFQSILPPEHVRKPKVF